MAEQEQLDQAKEWIKSVIGTEINDFYLDLKDGTILCNLINEITPNSCRISKGKLPFHQIENINQFISAVKKLGVPNHDIFELNDLYEQKSLKQVLITLAALSRHAAKAGWDGPKFGPKLADEKKYVFDEAVLKKSGSISSLQEGHYIDLSFSTLNDGGLKRQITEDNNYFKNKKN
ncbi:calponin domain-containing like protein [Tubulinosema ratisbonensis]|uniref:Calponin domain-containing like protein n=1 Tax=Tubulinosema ratisbonensis TaxID=291195 RepID=A0A437AIM0_9MICR|nr:calponin domain-containing like protein [Tubulinosema ratisbonensis]